jgi:DNA-binding CsgD family transcriptional regulator
MCRTAYPPLMDRLGVADRRRLLEFNHEAQDAALVDPNSAREFLLRSLSALVPADCAVHRLWDDGLGRQVTTATEPVVQASQDAGHVTWLAYIAQGGPPIVAYWNRSGDHGAVRLSDVIGWVALQRLEIYNLFWRPFAIDRAMGVQIQISSSQIVDLACYRSGSDFSERDRTVVDEMSYAVGQLARRAQVRGLVDASVMALGLTAREAEIIAWLTYGKTNREIGELLFLAPSTVKKHLDNIYRKLSIRKRMEAAALVRSVSSGADAYSATSGRGDLSRTELGVTPREAEVLALAARGKTNAEIGAVLTLSPGTAKRHLENIYRKLEVNTRTQAATLALASLNANRAD